MLQIYVFSVVFLFRDRFSAITANVAGLDVRAGNRSKKVEFINKVQ